MPDSSAILGLNAYHGDSSAALLLNGELAMAVEEERFNRIKHWAGLPVQAAAACLANTETASVSHVAISRNPRAHLFTKLMRLARQPSLLRQGAARAVNNARIFQTKQELQRVGLPGIGNAKFHFVEHHRAHLASAFFASPFAEAAVISVDGFGDFSSIMWGTCQGNQI